MNSQYSETVYRIVGNLSRKDVLGCIKSIKSLMLIIEVRWEWMDLYWKMRFMSKFIFLNNDRDEWFMRFGCIIMLGF